MKLMTYSNPLSAFDSFFGGDPFDAFAPLFDYPRREASRSTVEWFEDDSNYYARVDLPGVAREDLSVDFDHDLVSVSVKRGGSDLNDERSLRVPEGVEPGSIGAALANGVLTLTLPKAPEKKPVSIEIN